MAAPSNPCALGASHMIPFVKQLVCLLSLGPDGTGGSEGCQLPQFRSMGKQRFYQELNCLFSEAYFSLRLLCIIRANVHIRTLIDILVAIAPCREIISVQFT